MARKVIIYIFAIILIILIIYPLLTVLNILSVKNIANSFIGDIDIVFGLNPYLTKAILAAVTMPLLWLFVQSFNIFNNKIRVLARALLVLSLVIYYIILWIGSDAFWFDRNGNPLKCYVLTKKSIIFHRIKHISEYEVDQKTGKKCLPVTRGALRDLRIIKHVMNNGGVKELKSPKSFFDVQTGDPIVWYTHRKGGEYALFNAPVHDPVTGTRAAPMTRQEVRAFQDWLALKKRQEAEKARQAEAERKRRAEQKAAELERKKREEKLKAKKSRLAKMRELLAISVLAPTKKPHSGVHIVSKDNDHSTILATKMVRASLAVLSSVTSNVWKSAFIKKGYFAKVLNGNLAPAMETGVFQVLHRVLLGTLETKCKTANAVLAGGRTCTIFFDGRLISRQANSKVELTGNGFGVSEEQAVDKAAAQMAQRIMERLVR